MDLPFVERVVCPRSRADIPAHAAGQAYLAGGTWMFSEPQPGVRALVDLGMLGWPPLEVSEAGLRIAATCPIGTLEAIEAPADWTAAPLFGQCARCLLGSFKIAAVATVGGNVCLALPASPMLALTVALDGVAHTWTRDGGGREIPMRQFATAPQRTVLGPGELLRAIDLPIAALRRRAAARQASLFRHGRSAALLVATEDRAGPFALTITAATPQPMRLAWSTRPDAATLDATLAALPPETWYDDVHGAPAWRRHMTRRLAAELLQDLA